jgi:hypothetical protein
MLFSHCFENHFRIFAKIACEKLRKLTNVDFALRLLQKGKSCQQHVKESDNFVENILMTLNFC